MTAMTFSSPRENSMMSAGAAIRAIISTGMRIVVMMKDFFSYAFVEFALDDDGLCWT